MISNNNQPLLKTVLMASPKGKMETWLPFMLQPPSPSTSTGKGRGKDRETLQGFYAIPLATLFRRVDQDSSYHQLLSSQSALHQKHPFLSTISNPNMPKNANPLTFISMLKDKIRTPSCSIPTQMSGIT